MTTPADAVEALAQRLHDVGVGCGPETSGMHGSSEHRPDAAAVLADARSLRSPEDAALVTVECRMDKWSWPCDAARLIDLTRQRDEARERASALAEALTKALDRIQSAEDAMGHSYCAAQSGDFEDPCTCGFDDEMAAARAALSEPAPPVRSLRSPEDAGEARISDLVNVEREEDGSWTVSIPWMPGHVGAGATLSEAIDNAGDAGEAWLAAYKDRISNERTFVEARAAAAIERIWPRPEGDVIPLASVEWAKTAIVQQMRALAAEPLDPGSRYEPET